VNPYWLEDESVPRPSPRNEGTVDVAIVGAGVTGIAAAFRLAEAGLRVRVHDERAVAEGASGRNGGFAVRPVRPFDGWPGSPGVDPDPQM
jgi:glycine/D-amino acid oxidase-like deaminating enzyme